VRADTQGFGAAGPDDARSSRPPLLTGLPFAALLFLIWVVLSGKIDAFHLGAGVVTALVIARLTQVLFALAPTVGYSASRPLRDVAWLRVARYILWLVWQIVLSSLQIARVVLDPRLPIQPQVVTFRGRLPHTLARLTLANSITLTPGTVTTDVQGDTFEVHALTDDAAREIESDVMQERVRSLFGAPDGLEDG
jgi:multicomponent Na+:H+ antiporter subunit E